MKEQTVFVVGITGLVMLLTALSLSAPPNAPIQLEAMVRFLGYYLCVVFGYCAGRLVQ